MKIKFYVMLVAVALVFAGVQAQVAPTSAEEVLKAACSRAAVENKNVCIIFHASWCGWCHRMDSIMNMPGCKPLFETNWITEHLVVDESKPELKKLENPGGKEMMIKYKGKGSGIPYWLIFNPKGKLIADSRMPSKDKSGKKVKVNTGCPATEEEVAYFVKVLKKTTQLTQPEIDLIASRFLLKK